MCKHADIEIKTEKDRCFWARCRRCGIRGPKKNTVAYALARFRAVGNFFRGHGRRSVQYTRTDPRGTSARARGTWVRRTHSPGMAQR